MWHVLCSCRAILFTQSSKFLFCAQAFHSITRLYPELMVSSTTYIQLLALPDIRTRQPSTRLDFLSWLPFMLRWILDILKKVEIIFTSWDQRLVYSSHVIMLKQNKVTPRFRYPVGSSDYVSRFCSLFVQVHAMNNYFYK